MGRFALIAAILVTVAAGCGGGGTDAAAVEAACGALRDLEEHQQINDHEAAAADLRRAEKQAAASGDDDLAGYLEAAREASEEVATVRPRGPEATEWLAVLQRRSGNLALARAECAEAGHAVLGA